MERKQINADKWAEIEDALLYEQRDVQRLRELMKDLVRNAKKFFNENEIIVDVDDFIAIEKAVGDEMES